MHAIMYYIGDRVTERNTITARPSIRAELRLHRSGSLDEHTRMILESYNQEGSKEACRRAGYKILPHDTLIEEFVDVMIEKYPGTIKGKPSEDAALVVFEDVNLTNARRLMNKEGFILR